MVLDFGTEAVKVLGGGKRTLKYFDDYHQEKGLFEIIELILSEVPKEQKKIIITLPPTILKARIVSILFKRYFSKKIISIKEEKNIEGVILQRARRQIVTSLNRTVGVSSSRLRFVNLKILDGGIKIDGYEVPHLHSYRGSILEFQVLAIFLLNPIETDIEKILRKKSVDFRLIHEAECFQELLKDYSDGVFLDVGGKTTQIFLAKKGKLVAIADFEQGGRIFTQTISEQLGLREKDARIFKERYSNKELTIESSGKIKEMFYFPSKLWFNKLKDKLKEMRSQFLFPSNFFIFGGGSQLPEIKEALKKGNWEDIIFLDPQPKIKIFNDPQFFPSLLLSSYGQKVIDILPPESSDFLKSKKNKKEFVEKMIFKSTNQKSPLKTWKKILILLFTFIILAFLSLQFFFSKALVEIIPKTQPFNFSEVLTVDPKIETANFKKNLIKGIIFEVEKEITERFQSSGKVEKKAEGVIRLYNSFNTQAEIWRANTRFVSSGGKLFFSKDKILVPGAIIKNGKIEPSFVDVPVVAAESGEDYNIGPSKFSVAAFLGTAKYTKYYGESLQAMSGGGSFPKVTKEDIDKAETALTSKLKLELEEELTKKVPSDFVFMKEAVKTEILEEKSSVNPDQESENFEFKIRAKAILTSFKIEDLRNFSDYFISSRLESGRTFYKDGLKTEYKFQNFNSEDLKILILLKGSTQIYPEIDLNSLKRSLAGKSLKEAEVLLSNQEAISKTQIKLFPFWLRALPSKLEKTEVNLVIPQ
jgi:hypothetical protein